LFWKIWLEKDSFESELFSSKALFENVLRKDSNNEGCVEPDSRRTDLHHSGF